MFVTGLTFLVEGDERLGDGLADGVHLADVAAALDADPDVHVAEALLAQQEHGLCHLEAEDLGLDELQGGACAGDRPEERVSPGKQGLRPG